MTHLLSGIEPGSAAAVRTLVTNLAEVLCNELIELMFMLRRIQKKNSELNTFLCHRVTVLGCGPLIF